jgi:protease I
MPKKIAVLIAPDFEDSEFRKPVERLRAAGHEVTVLGEKAGVVCEGKQHEEKVKVEGSIADANLHDYDALLIPGGYAPDQLRTQEAAVDFVKRACASGMPVAAVCHGPQLLIEADVVRDHRVTSWPSVRTDLLNAGAHWVDEEVVHDGPLITSRKPEDLDAFSSALIGALG